MNRDVIRRVKNIILLVVNIILGIDLTSLFWTMTRNGTELYYKTDLLHKNISGSNFVMRVAIVNELSLVIKWLGVFGLLVVANLIVINIFSIWFKNLPAAVDKKE